MKYASDIFSALALASLYTAYIIFYPFSYNFNPEINLHNFFHFVSLGSFSIFLILYLFSRKTLHVNLVDITLFVLFVCFLSCIFFQHHSFNLDNEIFVCYMTMLVTYFIFHLSSTWVTHIFVPLVITFFFLFEITLGINQYFHFREAGTELSLQIKGTLQNSGVFSFYLVVNLPFCYYLLQHLLKNKTGVLIIFSFINFLTAMILLFTQSRTAMIAMIGMGAVFFLLDRFRKLNLINLSKTKRLALGVAFLILPTAVFLVSLDKTGSTYGRLLVWKVTASHIPQTIINGVGIGKFSYHYPLWQIQYTGTHSNLPSEYFLNADESHVAMNEYLEIIVENGLLGLICFTAFIIYMLSSKGLYYPKLIVPAKLTLTGILIAAFFSYPLHCTFLLFLFTLCCSLLSKNLHIKSIAFPLKNKFTRVILLFFYGLLFYAVAISMKHYLSVYKWQQLQQDVFAQPMEIKSRYIELYPALRKNGKFLVNYGEHLLDMNELGESAKILEESKRFYSSYRTYFSIVDAYYQSGNIPLAIKNLEYMSNLVPYKFYPKYQLARLYYRSGDSAKGFAMANLVLKMPVKIASAEVIRMKASMQELINKK